VVSSPCSTSQKSAAEVSEATSNGGGAESGSNVIVPFGMPELASEACGVLGAGLSKERM